MSNVINGLHLFSSGYRVSHQSVSSMEKGLKGREHAEESAGNTTKGESAATGDMQPPLQILVVPQLWLWKFDSECKFSKRM